MTALDWLTKHAPKLLALLSGTIATVSGVSGLIPETHLKYYMGAIAVLTYWQSFLKSSGTQQP